MEQIAWPPACVWGPLQTSRHQRGPSAVFASSSIKKNDTRIEQHVRSSFKIIFCFLHSGPQKSQRTYCMANLSCEQLWAQAWLSFHVLSRIRLCAWRVEAMCVGSHSFAAWQIGPFEVATTGALPVLATEACKWPNWTFKSWVDQFIDDAIQQPRKGQVWGLLLRRGGEVGCAHFAKQPKSVARNENH